MSAARSPAPVPGGTRSEPGQGLPAVCSDLAPRHLPRHRMVAGGTQSPAQGGDPPAGSIMLGVSSQGLFFFGGGLFLLHPTTAASPPGASILAQAVTGLSADVLGSTGKTWVEIPPQKATWGALGGRRGAPVLGSPTCGCPVLDSNLQHPRGLEMLPLPIC